MPSLSLTRRREVAEVMDMLLPLQGLRVWT